MFHSTLILTICHKEMLILMTSFFCCPVAKANASLGIEESSSDLTLKPMSSCQSRAFGFHRSRIQPPPPPRTPFYMVQVK